MAGYTLSQTAEKILDECLDSDNRRPPNDNLTLIIVDLQAYFAED